MVSMPMRRSCGKQQEEGGLLMLLVLGLLVPALLNNNNNVRHVEAANETTTTTTAPSLTTYLVHVPLRSMPPIFNGNVHGWYTSLLTLVNSGRQNRFVYLYQHVFEGFAVRLTAHEARLLAQLQEVNRVLEDGATMKLHTTHTPTFLDLPLATAYNGNGRLWNASSRGADSIVGVLDTGIWPEHPSFSNDAGLGPIPSRWNAGFSCSHSYLPSFDASTACNLKLIGARAFFRGYEAYLGGPMNETLEFRSPRDSQGHGTHTASTAVGSPVPDTSFFGFAPGIASGVAPLARLAVYKVCWQSGCFDTDILAGFDAAIADGVDIISISVGSEARPYWDDSIALGALAASRAGIMTVASAGNDGPAVFSVTNVAPWIFTVAASSVDRQFPASVTLGNGEVLVGSSLYSGPSLAADSALPLIYAANAAAPGADATSASSCADIGLLDTATVAGKIVVCNEGRVSATAKGSIIRQAGGSGMILANHPYISGEMLIADAFMSLAVRIGNKAWSAIWQYLNSTTNPTAILSNGVNTRLGTKPAPAVAAFSSRGPSSVVPEIMKPDITAPGLNILAAWSGEVSTSPIPGAPVGFNIISGTSMSCPHVAGVSALLRSAHRDWSPAMIRSALMTTAYTTDNVGSTLSDTYTGGTSNAWGYGAGHIDPNAALEPGLVYDISTQNYVDFICGLNGSAGFALGVSCAGTSLRPIDLNYPSFSVVFNETSDTRPLVLTTTRTLTNVGPSPTTYTLVSIDKPAYLTISTTPTLLSFDNLHKDLTYSITFTFSDTYTNFVSFGSLTWSDGVHNVTSPIWFLVTS